MLGLRAPELIVILVIVLVIFGPGKLPQIGDALGRTIKNFKKATSQPDEPVDVTPRRDQLPAQSTAAAAPPAEAPAAADARKV